MPPFFDGDYIDLIALTAILVDYYYFNYFVTLSSQEKAAKQEPKKIINLLRASPKEEVYGI